MLHRSFGAIPSRAPEFCCVRCPSRVREEGRRRDRVKCTIREQSTTFTIFARQRCLELGDALAGSWRRRRSPNEAAREVQDTRVISAVLPTRVTIMPRHLSIEDEDDRLIRVGMWVGFACFAIWSTYTLIFG